MAFRPQAIHRARLVARRRTGPPRQLDVLAAEYVRDLWAILDAVFAAHEAELLAAVRAHPDVRTDAIDGLDSLIRRIEADLQLRLGSHTLIRRLESRVERVGTLSAQELGRELQIAVPGFSEPGLLGRRWVDRNTGLGRSLADTYVSGIRDVLAQAPVGVRGESLAAEIAARAGITKRRARQIAVNETLALNSEITESQHRALGIVEYIWSSSKDGKVRLWHAALQDVLVNWDHPPMGGGTAEDDPGHAGSGIGCRCTPAAVLPGVQAPVTSVPTPEAVAEVDPREAQLDGLSAAARQRDRSEAPIGFSENPITARRQLGELVPRVPTRLGAEDGGARAGIRRAMRSVDPAWVSNDLVEGRDYAPVLISNLDEYGASALHQWGGKVELTPNTARNVNTALDALSGGQTPSPEGWNSLRVFVHEELHGSSRIMASAYEGIGIALEEASVELRARGMIQRLAQATSTQPANPSRPPSVLGGKAVRDGVMGSYQSLCERFSEAVAKVTNTSGQEAHDYLQSRLSAWFAETHSTIASPDALLKEMARHFAPQAARALEAEFRRVLPVNA
jgi:SPP1 gp7 family putative phage head morphogenesis protein